MTQSEPSRKTIFGPEPWTEIAGVIFVYWDRWLLRRALDEPDGVEGLVRRFDGDRKNARAGYKSEDAESKLSHLDDLKARLTKLGVSARDVLGDPDATDEKLLAKARTKLFEQGLSYKSPAMLDTPRQRLEARALRGHWDGFPTSPARFEHELMGHIGRQRDFDLQQTTWLSMDLDGDIERISLTLESEAEQLALRRAAVTLIVESMERVDDSGGDMGVLFADVWNAYLAMPWERTGILPAVFFRDLVEFSIWENYGLVSGLGAFFRMLAPDDAAVVETVFADVLPELHEHGFTYQEERALEYRIEFLLAQDLHDGFVEVAAGLGARAWRPILTMAKAALDADKRPLAMAIFAAADQPGPQRDYLRAECVKILGEPPQPTLLRRVK